MNKFTLSHIKKISKKQFFLFKAKCLMIKISDGISL